MSAKDDVLNLAKKLKALADRGVDGEKANAADKLVKFMTKHGISLDDIEERKVRERVIKYKTGTSWLISHIIWSVRNDIKFFGYRGKRTCFVIYVTDFEFVEIQYMIDLYLKAWKKELTLFQSAFIHKNDLTFTGETSNEGPKRSREESLRIVQMMNSIKKESRTKQLEK